MNKTVTLEKSYMSLLENSVNELFSPSSKKPVLNYSELNLINVDQLKVIDFDQLKLLDLNEFKLLNLAVLATFFQYIGAMFLTLSLGFMVAVGTFTLHDTINSTVLAVNSETTSEVARAKAREVARVTVAERPTTASNAEKGSFAALLESKAPAAQGEEAESVVLGSSTTKVVNSCSFRLIEGEKSERFSTGGIYSPSKVFKICVDSNVGSDVVGWGLGSNESENTSDCVNSYELVGVENITANVMGETGEVAASCELSLARNAVIAANNQ